MSLGPGKYAVECERDLRETEASAVLLIVLNGKKGNGFSMATLYPELMAAVPSILRDMANEIESSVGEG